MPVPKELVVKYLKFGAVGVVLVILAVASPKIQDFFQNTIDARAGSHEPGELPSRKIKPKPKEVSSQPESVELAVRAVPPTPNQPDERQRRLQQFQSLIRGSAPAPAGQRNSVIIFASSGPTVDFEPNQLLYGTLVSDRVHFISEPFPTAQAGFFDEIYAGAPDLIKVLVASTRADTVTVGRLNYTFRSSTSVAHDVVCEVTVTYKVIGTTGEVMKSDVVSGGAPSYSESAALHEAVTEVGKQLSIKLAKLL